MLFLLLKTRIKSKIYRKTIARLETELRRRVLSGEKMTKQII